MRDADAAIPPEWCMAANYRGEPAYRRCLSLLSAREWPTAILAADNVMVLDALQAINDLGFRCPADISLVSIDDVP